jgi:deazaflavin-dependent oxidoreductase (nitroreductase family)
MNRKPNTFQKLVHRFLMLKPVTKFLSVSLHHLDKIFMKLTNGKYTITALVGLPVIQLTTVGAKSGEKRTMPLVSLFDGDKIALIASNFGGKNNPGWYYNLKANPKCAVEVNGRAAEYIARQAEGEEREKYWRMAVSYYKGYEQYKIRAAHRVIPVMILELDKKDS